MKICKYCGGGIADQIGFSWVCRNCAKEWPVKMKKDKRTPEQRRKENADMAALVDRLLKGKI